jgi:hypothetical protein
MAAKARYGSLGVLLAMASLVTMQLGQWFEGQWFEGGWRGAGLPSLLPQWLQEITLPEMLGDAPFPPCGKTPVVPGRFPGTRAVFLSCQRGLS